LTTGRATEQAATALGASFPVLKGNAGLFSSLTFGQVGNWLDPVPADVIAVGLVVGARPVGLALGHLQPGRTEAVLTSIAVAPAFRRKGLGKRLLDAWLAEASGRGATRCVASYIEAMSGRVAFESLLADSGWTPPCATGLVVVGRVGRMVDAVRSWSSVTDRLAVSRTYSFDPLDLTAADVAEVDRYLADPEAADMRGPLRQTERLARDFSIVIRREGRLVGWVLAAETHRPLLDGATNGPAIRYLEAYLDPAHRRGGIMVGAYYHCYAKQMAQLGGDSIAVYYTSHETRPRMVALSQRRFAPIAERVDPILSSRMSLNSTEYDADGGARPETSRVEQAGLEESYMM
jgi:GNAT superfamily N-acetyltransferase